MAFPVQSAPPPFTPPTAVAYPLDRGSILRLSIAALGPWVLILQALRIAYTAVALALLARLGWPLLFGSFVLIFVGMQLQFYAGLRSAVTVSLRQLSGGPATVTYTATIDGQGIEVGVEDHQTKIRWTGFSGYFTSRQHLVLYRGGCPSISLPMDSIPPLFLAGVTRQLVEAEVPAIKPPKHSRLVVFYSLAAILLLGLLFLVW